MQTSPTNPQHTTERPTLRSNLVLYLKGLAMGSADVVPGVSGGTMALILGIYEELIESLRNVSTPAFFNAVRRLRIGEAFKVVNGAFLVVLVAGIATAIGLFSSFLPWLLETQQVFVYSFFFGLVAASTWAVGRRVTSWSAGTVVALIASALGAFFLVGLSPATTPEAAWFIVLSGALAICAMVLPGISGSFILLLMGKYAYVLDAVSDLNFTVIFLFGTGALVGLLSFVRLLSWLFDRYYNLTIALLTGFLLGSLRKIYPWKSGLISEEEPTLAVNVLPQIFVNGELSGAFVGALVLLVLGAALVLVLEWVGKTSSS